MKSTELPLDPITAGLVKGVYIKITKVSIKDGCSSKGKVGYSAEGELSKNLQVYWPVLFIFKGEEGCATTFVRRIFTKDKEMYLETKTSIYKIMVNPKRKKPSTFGNK